MCRQINNLYVRHLMGSLSPYPPQPHLFSLISYLAGPDNPCQTQFSESLGISRSTYRPVFSQ